MPVAIVDDRICEKGERELMLRGFNVIKMPHSKRLPEPMRSHPDMLMLVHENRIITSADYAEEALYAFSDVRVFSKNAKITFCADTLGEKYPYDAIFNSLIIGDMLFCKKDTVSKAVLEYAEERGLRVVGVRQGYPACTTLALSASVAITADEGMARALRENGIDVTLIENGDISLPPYEYGFIGGAAGVFKDTVYFLGDITTHRSKDAIFSACERARVHPVSLFPGGLRDLGRILFVD